MTDWTEIIGSLTTGLLSGGATALTTLMGVFRDLRKRIRILEEFVGHPDSLGNLPTGLHLRVYNIVRRLTEIEDLLRKMQKDLEDLEDEPPDWVVSMVNRARTASSTNMELQQDFENRIEGRLRSLRDRFTREIEDLQRELQDIREDFRNLDNVYLQKDVYTKDSQRRSVEISRIKENLASVNGLMRGILAAMGIIDSDKKGFH